MLDKPCIRGLKIHVKMIGVIPMDEGEIIVSVKREN